MKVRLWVFAQTALIIAALQYAAWNIHILYVSGHVRDLPISLAISILALQGALIVALLLISSVMKKRTEAMREYSARVAALIRGYLADHVAHIDRSSALRGLCLWHGFDVQRYLIEFLSTVSGEAHDRLSTLARSLGIRWLWHKMARYGSSNDRRDAAYYLGLLASADSKPLLRKLLSDPSPRVQAAACRSLLRIGEAADIEQTLLVAVDAPLLVRVILVSDAAPPRSAMDAVLLQVIRSNEARRIAAALDLARAWSLRVSYPLLQWCLIDRRIAVRSAAMLLLALHTPEVAETWMLAGLADLDRSVRLAALNVVRRQRMRPAIPVLRGLLASGDPALIRESCRGLAAMGSEGWRVLEDSLRDSAVATQAAEALSAEQVRRSPEFEYA